jgi:hypothetical protein
MFIDCQVPAVHFSVLYSGNQKLLVHEWKRTHLEYKLLLREEDQPRGLVVRGSDF